MTTTAIPTGAHCRGMTNTDEPCGRKPKTGRDYCGLHDPERKPKNRRRRASTFGTVTQLPSKHWRTTYWHGGKKHSQTFPTRADAGVFLSRMETSIRDGGWVSPQAGKMTVNELGQRWLASDPSKRTSTYKRDEAILRRHIKPKLGLTTIAQVSKARVQALVNEWAKDLAPRTVQRQYDVLRAMFTYAVDNDLLSRSPCRNIKEPESPQGNHRSLTSEDIAAISDATVNEYRPMVYVGAVLGLRWGEVAGLRVGSLDLSRSLVTVDQQLGRDLTLGSPKSRAGVRTLTMPEPLTELLRTHVTTYGLIEATKLLFSAPEGGPLDYTNWRRRTWLTAVEKAGLKGVTFHDLRRAAATALVRLGVDIKTAQTRLGHSDPRLTLAVYAQATSEADQDAAVRLGNRFFGSINHAGTTPDGEKEMTAPQDAI